MNKAIPVFKQWVPEWLIKVLLFLLQLPSIALFFLPLANINAGAGYYGCEPADVQFAVALFFAGCAGFYSLERRFFAYLAAKEYFVLFTFLQILTCLICYNTRELCILFPVRFIQGMLFCSTVNMSLSLMFTRLTSGRSREISFSVFFGIMLCAVPFNNLGTADLIDAYNFNVVYKEAAFAYLPCLCMLLLSMNSVRLNIRFPLYKLDWQSFSLFSIILCLIGYMLIYGQEYYWLEDDRMQYSILAIAVLSVLYIIRQRSMKRPYLNLAIFKSRNLYVGLYVLFIMYICRLASGVTNNFFTAVLGFDPIHLSYINLLNIAGLVGGVIISCCLLLQKRPIQYIWLPGFALLLVFHVSMFFLFNTQANAGNYLLPLFIQGLGVGMIMVPTIVYTIAAVPVAIGPSAAAASLTIRYFGFCASIGIINYCELYGKSRHFNTFQDHLTKIDRAVLQTLNAQSRHLMDKGMIPGPAVKASGKLLVGTINRQDQIRFAIDYYELMSLLIIGVLLVIALFPYLNRTVAHLRSRRLTTA